MREESVPCRRPTRAGRLRLSAEDGLQVEGAPQQFGSGSALHRRFQEWAEAGVFHIFVAEMLHYYDDRVGVDLKWCSLDSASVKAPRGETTRVPIPPIAQNALPTTSSKYPSSIVYTRIQ